MRPVRLRRSVLGLVLSTCLAGTFAGCGGDRSRSSSPSGGVAAEKHTLVEPACEANPLDGVHHPARLNVLDPCAAFQGTVNQAPKKFPDGDMAFSVSPDPGYEFMLNAKNQQQGGLHIEIVPRDQPGCTPGQSVVVGNVPGLGVCSGRDVPAPLLGAHVRIIGPWVLDRNDNWHEIHPAWSITAPAVSCRVPRVIGRTLRKARAALAKHGCSLGKISHRSSRRRLKGHVVAQRPQPGSLVAAQSGVHLTIGRGHRHR
jgi:hypothetical protein